jgi:hypothetical protein
MRSIILLRERIPFLPIGNAHHCSAGVFSCGHVGSRFDRQTLEQIPS